MNDSTESIRRARLAEINAHPGGHSNRVWADRIHRKE
jgi:hypothetical protein